MKSELEIAKREEELFAMGWRRAEPDKSGLYVFDDLNEKEFDSQTPEPEYNSCSIDGAILPDEFFELANIVFDSIEKGIVCLADNARIGEDEVKFVPFVAKEDPFPVVCWSIAAIIISVFMFL